MENLTYNLVEMIFYNFQPVSFTSRATDELFRLKANMTKLPSFIASDMPAWLKEFNHAKSVFNNIKSISLEVIDTQMLLDEVKDHFVVNGEFPLSNFVSRDGIAYYLLFDVSTFHWMLCYELKLMVPENSLLEILNYKSDKHEDNLYNSIRQIFVKEYDDSVKSNWVCEVEKTVFKEIHALILDVYNIKLNADDLFIDNNSGNITNVAILSNKDEAQNRDIIEGLLEINRLSERVEYFEPPIQLNHTTTYSFNGRFHTIISNTEKYRYRFLPIQYQMQFMWNYLDYIYKKMDDINNVININSEDKINKRKIGVIDHIINKVQYLRVFHENFKRAIENDNTLVYAIIEKKWNIENFVATTDQYVDNFISYIDRMYARKGDKNSKRQNNLLFVLSIIQTIALMSVWSDYISIVDPNNINSAQSIIDVFGSVDKLLQFNVILPLVFIAIIIIFIAYMAIGSGKDE